MRPKSTISRRQGLSIAALLWAIGAFAGDRTLSAADCQTFVYDPVTGSVLTPGIVGQSYSAEFRVVSGGTPPFHFSASPSAPLPQGLSVFPASNDSSTAIIGGVPGTAAVGPRTFFINVSDSLGCTNQVEYAINITVGNACNPPITLAPPGGSLQPTKSGDPIDVTLEVHGATSPISVQTSGGPGLAFSSSLFTDQLDVLSLSVTTPGTYTFTVTVTDARGCSATGTYSITVVDPDAPCTIQLHVPAVVQVRVGGSATFNASAVNIGNSPCTGADVTFDFGSGTPLLTPAPGSAFTLTGPITSSSQELTGTGTIPAGGSVGVTGTVTGATPGVVRVPWTVQATYGPTSHDVLTGTTTFDTKSPRLSNRSFLNPNYLRVHGRNRKVPGPVPGAAPDDSQRR